MGDYLLCGWHVRSDLPFSELRPWPGGDGVPDVRFRFGAVPPPLPVLASDMEGDIAEDGSFQTEEAGLARYHVSRDGTVTVEAWRDPNSALIRELILSTVLGVLCHQRSLLPLHGCCVVINGRAVMIAGDCGAGKSALAAVLAQRGHAILADDVSALPWPPRDSPLVLPGVACLRICRDVMSRLSIPFDPTQDGVGGKYALPGLAMTQGEPAKLAAIYHLSQKPGLAAPRIEPLSRLSALGLLHHAVFRGGLANGLGRGPAVFQAVASLAATIPNYRLLRSDDLDALDLLADLVTKTAK